MYAAEWPCCHDPLRFSLGSDDLLRTRNNPPSDATGASLDILSPAPPPLCDAQSQSSSFPVSTSTHRSAPLRLVGRGQPSIIVFAPLAFLYCAPCLWPLARHPFHGPLAPWPLGLLGPLASSPPWPLARPLGRSSPPRPLPLLPLLPRLPLLALCMLDHSRSHSWPPPPSLDVLTALSLPCPLAH